MAAVIRRFWVGFFKLELPSAVLPSPAAPLLVLKNTDWAVEVIRDESGNIWEVLFSTVSLPAPSARATCRIGFANQEQACSLYRDRGFPFVDACIRPLASSSVAGAYDITVFAPYFNQPGSMEYEQKFFTIEGVEFQGAAPKVAPSLSLEYDQFAEAPDATRPATVIAREERTWKTRRSAVQALAQPATLDVEATRIPQLLPFLGKVAAPTQMYAGIFGGFDEPPRRPRPPLQRVSRAETVGPPAFRFEKVQAIGFRIDLRDFGADLDRRLEQLIKPLNFHLDLHEKPEGTSGRNAMADFRYRPATPTLLVELLRYGEMKLLEPGGGMLDTDFQGQHELVLRILVGRVDDDSAQARQPAIFVPAIFVDNPWSKILGRDLQGFDKRLASFCSRDAGKVVTLCPDGYVENARGLRSASAPPNLSSRPLTDVCHIALANVAGVAPASSDFLLGLDYSGAKFAHGDSGFEEIDLELAMGRSALAYTRWRQTDFEEPEFRRSFARSAVRKTLKGFRSIQAAPIGDRGLDKTWISGTFEVDEGLRFARPSGVAKLTFNAPPGAPEGWQTLCEVLGGQEITFASGEWYQMRTSMTFTVDDGLEWD